RAGARQKEIAIRASLGATRSRIIGQLLTESLVLSLVASLLGLLLAALGTRAIVAFIPRSYPAQSITQVSIDGRVLVFTLTVALLTGLAFGLVPALTLSGGALHDTLKSRVAVLPGVRAVGAISFLPLSGERSSSGFAIAGRPTPSKGEEPTGDMRAVTPGYFQAMGIPIKAGRGLTDADLASTPAV